MNTHSFKEQYIANTGGKSQEKKGICSDLSPRNSFCANIVDEIDGYTGDKKATLQLSRARPETALFT
jgi:hypothetical protein